MTHFTVSCAFTPSRKSNSNNKKSYLPQVGRIRPNLLLDNHPATPLPTTPREDLDIQCQRMQVQAEQTTQGRFRVQNEELSFRRRPEDEVHHLRTLVISAVHRQGQLGSIGLSLTVEKATSRNLSRDVYTQDQVEEANEILNNSGAFNMNYIAKTLLADVEMLYKNHGYAAALRAFNQLRPWDLVFPENTPRMDIRRNAFVQV